MLQCSFNKCYLTELKHFSMNSVTEGRKHDAGMLADSHLLHDLHQYAFSLTGQPLCIYGDPA